MTLQAQSSSLSSTNTDLQKTETEADNLNSPSADWKPPFQRRAEGRYAPLVKVPPRDQQELDAMPHPGRFQLVVEELRRSLSPQGDTVPLDRVSVDPVTAAIWHLLAHDADVAADATPAVAMQSAIDKLEAEIGKEPTTQAGTLVREAAKSMVDGLRELDPDKLYDAYRKTSAAYEITRGKKAERLQLQDVASGWFAKEPDLELRGRPELRTSHVVRRDGLAFIVALSDAMRMLESSATAADGPRITMARVMEQIVRATILKEPFLIDAEAVAHMAKSSAPADVNRLNALRGVYLMLQRLAKRGLSTTPRFVSLLQRESGHWSELPGGTLLFSDADLLDKLSAPLSPPLPLKNVDPVIDQKAPLQGMTGGKRLLRQTLDRAQGRIDIEFDLDLDSIFSDDGRAFKSTVYFDALPTGATSDMRLQQDRQIRQLDDFIRAHFLRVIDKPENSLPPEIRMKGDEIFVGKLRVATRLDDRWTGDAEAIKRAVATLWVHDWTPASFPQTRGRLGVARPSFGKGAKRLTLVLQMENDGVITRNGDIMVKQHPNETASVQLNREGGFRIVAGEDLIRGLGSGGLVKIVVIGHGIRRGNLDEPALSGYSPAALSSRVDAALRELRLPRRVDRVTLFSCTLESPVYPRSFASEFLLAADKAGFLRPQASVTAYAENVALSPFGSRRTQPHGDARMEVHRPETTFSFHIDAKTKTVVRTDKYPGTSEDGITGPVQRIDADIRLVGAFVAQDDPSWRPGAAGKLFEMFSTLHDTAKKMSIGKSGGGDIDFPQEMPDAISDAVQRQLSALEGVEPQKVVDPGGLTRAAKLISDGVWQRNPDLIYNAYQELSKAFGEESVRWQLDDLPMGVVDQVRMPSQLLSQYPSSLMLPIEEFALMKGLEAGVTAVDGLPTGQGSDASRVHFNRQTLELLKVTLSGRPFAVDKDLVDTLRASADPADRARLRTLEVVHGAAMKLVNQGVVQSPIYLTDFPQGGEAGWTRHDDGSSIHQGDLLPGLLPGRRSEVMRARTGTSIEFDDAKPLTRLFAFMPAAKQTLDREAGTITIDWPNTTSGKQAASVLRFRPADATPGSHSQKLQEAEIRMIDEFLVGAFFDSSLLSFNALPGDLRLEGDALIAARAILARRRDGQWVPDSEALRRHWVVVGTGVARGTPEKPVSSWDSSLDGLGDGAGDSHRVRKERLLVVLQMEDDLVLSRYVRRALVRNESDVVWIQVDGLGQHVIRAGARFLPTTDKDRPVKIEILGHGGHDLTTRSQTLSGYLSTQLVDRVAPVLDELKLKSRAGHVTLVSCALETPSIEHSFGQQFLQYATDQGVIALDAEVVAYRDVLGVDMRPGHEWTSRFTEPYPGAGRETHAPGSTWLFKKNPGTGEIERSDKYPKPPVDDSSTTDLADNDLDETLTDYDLSDRGLDPSTTFIPGRRGRAGTLMTALETLERVLRRAKLGPLKGDPPEALLQAIEDELLKVRPEQSDVDATRAPVAAKAIAEGLWTMSPKKLYEGFVALSQMYGSGAGAKVAFHFGDLPAGLVANVRFPSKVLEAFHKSMAIPAAEAGLLRAMRVTMTDKVPTQVWLTNEMDPDLMRMMLVRHTADLVESILSGRPFVVDVDQLKSLSPPGLKRKLESPKLDVLTAVHGTAVQLARRGAVASPIYMTDAKTDLGDGWERFGDGSSIHRGDLLPTLLPQRKGDITRARALLKTAVDGDKPLKDLSEIVPDARQVLDRDKGTITITWPGAEGTRQASTVLKFRSLNGDTSQALRDLQDADIVALDRFIVPAFIHQPASRKNSMPAELRLADGTLTASRATLAKLDDKRWTPQMETILQAQYLLGVDSDVKPATPVEQWEHDFDSERAPAGLDQGKTGKLRIVIQLEDDPKILRGAHRAIRRHPLETVWIQVDRLGKHKIRHGSHLLENLDPATPIKLTLKGHGRIDGVSRTAHIGYSKPAELAGRVAPVLEALKLTSRIEQAVLTGCAMVAPFLVDDYAETFLELAIEKGILRHDASLEAYAENVVLTNVAVHKGTRRFEGEKKQAHAVGATWIYKKSSETKKILRTDKFPASESSAYGMDKLEVIYREDSRNLQPGRAGKLFESLETLAATQARGGISKTQGDAPDTAVQAVRERLQSLYSELEGVSEEGLSKAAKSIADGLWQRDPSKVYEGYGELSRLCAAQSRHAVKLTWDDLPMGVVDRVRLPSQVLWKWNNTVSMPLPDAALVHGMQAAMTIMDGPPLDPRPDATGRAFARQTLALVEATLSGRPFVIDADAVFRMSTSKEADARARLDVLDVAYATSMQLSRRNVIEAPIYLTDQQRLDVGWERHRDGSLVHRGDLLPSILPERGGQLKQLQTPAPVAVDESTPLSTLTRFMPGATQTLDRKAGTIRIAWPDLTDGKQADSVLKFSPSDAGPGTEDRRRQDADILALDDFIIGEFFESAGPVRNGLPEELAFDGIRVIAGRAVLAERKDGRWLRDDAALRQARSILEPWTSTAIEELPAMKWLVGDVDVVTNARTSGKAARLLIHLQMEDDPVMRQGARGTVKHHPDETVWIQVDRQGNHVIRHGAELLAKADATLPVKIEVSGHGTHDHATRTQRLAGYGAEELATRLKSVITDLKLTSRAKNLTLVSCAIETPVVSGSFGTAFTKAAIDEGVVHQDATVVAYGEVLLKPSGLDDGRRSRSTRRHPDVAPVAHAPGVTWMFRKHADTGEILKIDKYPDAESGIDGADEDSPQRQLKLHREEASEAMRRNATDDLAGRSLRLHGIDVPADFLASLGARFDDEPLTGDLLRAMADQPGDPLLRLKIDPERLERWVALLPGQADVELGDRLHALGRWMDAREKADGAGAAFTEAASTKARATADRLMAASRPDGDGNLSSDADLLKAARGDEAGSKGWQAPPDLSRTSSFGGRQKVVLSDPTWRRSTGHAGKLKELFRLIERGLGAASVSRVRDPAPDKLFKAIRAELESHPSLIRSALLPVSAELIADGLWQCDPGKLYKGFEELSRMYDEGTTAEIHWGDRPLGSIGGAKYPLRMAKTFSDTMDLPSAEVALVKALQVGADFLANDGSPAPESELRRALSTLTEQSASAVVSGRPFAIDVDALKSRSSSGKASDTAHLRILEVVHGAAVQLARQGAMSAPIYLTDAPVTATDGWETCPDGSSLHRGDLLPDLLPDRKAEIEARRAPSVSPIDPVNPLARLAEFMPAAKQTLNRARGTISIVWPEYEGSSQVRTTVQFISTRRDKSSARLELQDAEIRALDDFIVNAFFDAVDPTLNSVPVELTLSKGVLNASRAVLARRVDGRWIPDNDAIEAVRLIHGQRTGGKDATSVESWNDAMGDALVGVQGKDDAIGEKLRVYLQLEDDKDVFNASRRAVRNHPNATVLVQVDRLGGHRVVYGEHLLKQVDSKLPVKITLFGHGTHDRDRRSQRHGHSSPRELVMRTAPVIRALGLEGRAEQAVLLGCALVPPSINGDFAMEFLEEAISQRMFRDDVALSAYAEIVMMNFNFVEDPSPYKETRRHNGEEGRLHAPGATWLYKKDPETGMIVRTDRHPAGDLDLYGVDRLRVVERDAARDLQPGRAGKLFESLDTLAATQARGGISKTQDDAPDTAVQAVRERLQSLFSKLEGVSEDGLSKAAKSIADGLWQRDPSKVYEGYDQLSRLCTAESGHVVNLTWGDLPTGVVDRTRLPSQLLWKFDKDVSMPLPDAALVHGMQAAVTIMDGPPLDARPDAAGRAFARQTLALVEATLSGRPFIIDADAVFRMSTSKEADARATLEVLDVAYATSMQLSRRNVIEAPIYLTDAQSRLDVGWERYPDGSLVHRGDILPSILPERGDQLKQLQTPVPVAVDETNPLSKLTRFMPGATQTLDRKAGTIRIAWPDLTDGRQADSVLKFSPSDAGPGTEDRRRQDADILALDDFIIGEFFESAGPVRNGLPGELTFDGIRVIAGRAVLAERKDGRWLRDDAALRQARSILGPRTSTAREERPAMKWFGQPVDAVTDARPPGKAARLLIHLQMEEDLVMQQGAQGTVKHHPDEAVWIQVDRQGNHVIRHGAELLAKADATLPVKIEVSGHGTHDHATRTQRLAGYGAEELATRLKSVITDLKLTSRAKNLTLVSCAIETPVVSGSFGTAFTKAAIDEGVVHQDATVVAYGEVLVKPHGLGNGRRSRSTRRHPDVAPVAHAPGVTWMFRKHADTGEILKIDKYPDAESGIDGADEDSPQRQLELHREEAYEAVRRHAADDLAGRSLRLHGIDVPADFLASLGARFDDEPLTGDLLRAMADQPGDPLLRLKIDPELLERWVALLPEQADVELGDRLHALGRWMNAREKADGAGAAFIEPASTEERATADRLIAAVKADDDGNLSSDADLLKAARGDETASTSLLGEILQDLSPQTRTDFEDWMKRTGQSFEDVKAMAPSKVSREGDTPVEKVAREIERRARGDEGIDFDRIRGVNKDNAIAALREIGVVKADRHGLRLDAARLQSYIDSGDGVKLAYAGRALRKMSGKAYRALLDAAPAGVRPFMTETRAVPSAGKKSFAGFADKFDGAIDVVDTVLGMYQILSNWDRMSQTEKGLSVTQSLSIVISPLAMMAGRAMSTLGLVARSALLRGVSAGLAGGGANVALSALGVASCVLQWEEFNASGQSLDSYAGKSLIANTVMTATSALLAVASAGVGIAVFVAGGAVAVAGTALGLVSSVLGPVGIGAAVIMFIANAVTQAVLWFEEYEQYMHDSTSLADKIHAGFAKAFGFSTDVTLRAETEKAAREAAARLSQSLRGQFQDSLEFEAKMLAKQQGYDTAMIPETTHPVKHATFYDPESSQKYHFALQPHAPTAKEFRKVVQDKPLGSGSTDTAWLSMDLIKSRRLDSVMYGHRPKDVDRQLFQLGNLVGASVFGGHGADIFQVKKIDQVHIDGRNERHSERERRNEDEVQIDAEGSDVTLMRVPPTLFHPTRLTFPGLQDNWIYDIHRFVIRNAGEVVAVGSVEDDFFDISAREATISGGEGRNTYVVRNGNRISVDSSGVAIWTRGVNGAVIELRSATASLLLKVDVLHESLSFRRNGKDLDILIGEESLTLKRYFERLEASSPGSAPPVVFVDVVGTVVTLSNPGAINKRTRSITELDKDLAFSTELPASRRTLTGDDAQNTYRLLSGSGDVQVLPMTGTPMNILLDVPVERLGLTLEGDDLLVVETSAPDAPADFTPLRLRLPGQRRSSSNERFDGVTIWAKDKDQKPAALVLPEPGKWKAGPVRVRESGKETAEITEASATKNGSSTTGQGTDKADKIDAKDLPDGSVLRGGGGADTYLIKAGQSLVIDNSAADWAVDVLEVEGLNRHQLLDEVRFARQGRDLVIALSGGEITLQDYAAQPSARHLSLSVAGKRFALPVVQDGFMVHLPSSAEDDVLATTPGQHVILLDPSAAWRSSAAGRQVWMRRPDEWRRQGSSMEAIINGDRASTVLLMDYQHAPEAWHLKENLSQAEGGEISVSSPLPFGGSSATEALYRALAGGDAAPDTEYSWSTVEAYLQARGMPQKIATKIRSQTFGNLQRLHQLLAVAVDGDDWQLPADFINNYVSSDLTPSSAQGPLIRHLASRNLPWAYDERVLRNQLSRAQLDAFESWATDHIKGGLGFSDSLGALDSFVEMLNGIKPQRYFDDSLVAKVLELKGRPAAAAEELALVMVAAGTMDEKWAAGMLQAGVVHHDVLKRLWDAGVSPQDVMLSNANRLRYEGSGDRSSLIAVDTSSTFKSPTTKITTYELNTYMKLDSEGEYLEPMDASPTSGVTYDFGPGKILDQYGESPDWSWYEAWYQQYLDEKEYPRQSCDVTVATVCYIHLPIAPPSSVFWFVKNGYAKATTADRPGSWDGRSQPQNLVDGFLGHDEVVAWRPGGPTPSSANDKSKPDITIDSGKYIQFDFQHPVALSKLTVTHASSPSSPDLSEAQRNDASVWKLQAESKDGRWVDVSPKWTIRGGEHATTTAPLFENNTVPYQRYRMAGVAGRFPKVAWFSEVVFTTVEAGASPANLVETLRTGGFSNQEIRGLLLHGLDSKEEAKAAVRLRSNIGALPPDAIMGDINGFGPLEPQDIGILNRLKADGIGSTDWTPQVLLNAVRLRGSERHFLELNAQLPFFDPSVLKDNDFRRIVEVLQADRADTSLKYATAGMSWLPEWLKSAVSLSPLNGGLGSKWKGYRIRHHLARKEVDAQYAKLAASVGAAEAKRVTAPWYLHLAAVMAVASNRELRLRIAPGSDPIVDAVILNALARLQTAHDQGVLKVSIASSLPPVGNAAAWLVSTQGEEILHLSSGADLVAEHGQALSGQPVARLVAGGFTEEDATAMAAHGVSTLDRITRAIEMRRLFGGLSWKLIADGVILDQPFDEGQLRLAGYLATQPWWQQRPEASSAAVRRGLTAEERTKLLDGLLPAGGHALIQSRRLGHLVRKVMDWLRQAQDPDGKETPSPANTKVAVELVQAAAGLPGALRRALELAGVAKWKRPPAKTTEAPPWAPQMLQGFISLVPVEGEVSEVSLDAPIEIVVSTYEKLLEKIGEDLRAEGRGTKNVAEALRPKYVDLAVLRAAIGGQELLLHVPPGESSEEQSVTTLFEARLAGLQKARDLDLLRVRIASSMPARGDDEPWATTLVDGTTWHLSSEATLDAAWKRGKDSQVIPRLREAEFDAADAQALYDLSVRTMTGVARAIQLRRFLPELPADVIAGDVKLPPLPEEDLAHASVLASFGQVDDVKALAALRDNTLVSLREVRLDAGGYSAPVDVDLILQAYGSEMGSFGEDHSDLNLQLSSLKKSLGESLPHLLPEHDKAVGDVAVWLMRPLTGGRSWMNGTFPLSLAILTLESLQIRTGRPLLPAPESTPWMPERLRGLASFVDVDAGGRGIALPTLVVLRAFEDLLEKVEARLDERGLKTASASRALDHHFLRLAIMRAAAGGQRLLLHVPQTASPKDRLRKDLIHAALRGLERARVDGLVDVAIASSQPPVDQKLAWSTQTLQGSTLHVASAQPLEAAWQEGLGGYPVHRMAKAGYSDDDAQALVVGGINTLELADRAVQLRELFGTLSTDVVLKDVLEKPAFTPWDIKLASNLQWLAREYGLDALALARAGGSVPVIRVAGASVSVIRVAAALLRARGSLVSIEEIQQSHKALMLQWLVDTQGPDWSSTDADVNALTHLMSSAGSGNVSSLTGALSIGRKLGLTYHGRTTVDDDGDWVPEAINRHAKLRPADGTGGPSTLAASDYVILQGFKRLVDAVGAELLKLGERQSDVTQSLEPLYLQLQVLRAAATGQHVELRAPVGDRHETFALSDMIESLRLALKEVHEAGVLKVSFVSDDETDSEVPDLNSQEVESDGQGDRPVKRAKRAAEEPTSDLSRGEDSRRQAALLMQDIASRTDVDPGVTSFSAVRTMPSPMTFLTGQTA